MMICFMTFERPRKLKINEKNKTKQNKQNTKFKLLEAR